MKLLVILFLLKLYARINNKFCVFIMTFTALSFLRLIHSLFFMRKKCQLACIFYIVQNFASIEKFSGVTLYVFRCINILLYIPKLSEQI